MLSLTLLSHCSAYMYDAVNMGIQGSCRSYISACFFLLVVKHDEQTALRDLQGDPAASSNRIVFCSSDKGHILYSSPGYGVISLSGISSTSFTPFSHHLPRRLRRIPLLTSQPLMPFSIDHYPPLPSPLLAIAQSETPASPWSLLCGRCSWEVKRLRSGTFGCLLWCDLWGPHAVPSYWRIWVASNGDSDVAQSYCC